MRTILPWPAILLSFVIVACGSPDDGSTDRPATRASLAGHTFVATDAEGHDLDEDVPIEFTFSSQGFKPDVGCNGIGGAYTTKDGAFRLQAFSTTEVLCPPAIRKHENWVYRFLSGDGVTARLSGDTLVLTDEDGVSLTLTR